MKKKLPDSSGGFFLSEGLSEDLSEGLSEDVFRGAFGGDVFGGGCYAVFSVVDTTPRSRAARSRPIARRPAISFRGWGLCALFRRRYDSSESAARSRPVRRAALLARRLGDSLRRLRPAKAGPCIGWLRPAKAGSCIGWLSVGAAAERCCRLTPPLRPGPPR